ncbi:MAG: hypothetical protein WC314_23990 [Vulcanimicrobiota bacterium]
MLTMIVSGRLLVVLVGADRGGVQDASSVATSTSLTNNFQKGIEYVFTLRLGVNDPPLPILREGLNLVLLEAVTLAIENVDVAKRTDFSLGR